MTFFSIFPLYAIKFAYIVCTLRAKSESNLDLKKILFVKTIF